LQVAEQRFLHNKRYAKVHHVVVMQGLEHTLKCFALNFNKAVETICRDVNKTIFSIVRELTNVKRFHSCVLLDQTTANNPPNHHQSVCGLT
jgi:hypothetical protein